VPDGEELPLLLGARRMIARADEGDPGGPVTSIRELADKYGITIRAELADPPRQTWRDRPPLL
jgi:hypothetical protein